MKGNQMKTGQKRIVRAFVIIAVTAAFLIPDVITKRWAETTWRTGATCSR